MSFAPVTVLVVGYNQARFVTECLDSILRQTMTPAQVLIPTTSLDTTDAVIRSYMKEHPGFAEYYPNETNRGLTRTLNGLLARVTTPYVTYIAADDFMMPHRLERHVQLMERDTFALVYSDAVVVDENSSLLFASSRFEFPWPEEPARSQDTFGQLLIRNWIPAASFFMRTDALTASGGYCEDIFYEDYELLVRLAHHHRFGYIEEPLVAVRRVPTSLGTLGFRADNPLFIRAMDRALQHYVGARPDLEREALTRRWELAKRATPAGMGTRGSVEMLLAAHKGASSIAAFAFHLARALLAGSS